MPRQARQKAESGYYHIMNRGNERRSIFMDDEDRQKYLDLLARQVGKGNVDVLAYCLMDNHIHLLIREGANENGLTAAMRSLGTAYVGYFNEKYNRSGHLFQNRYKGEAVENEAYLLTALRYIHQNPVKAGICSAVADYPWSSDCFYRNPSLKTFVNREILQSLAGTMKKAISEYSMLMEIQETQTFSDIEPPPISKAEITHLVEREFKKAGIVNMDEKGSREALAKVAMCLHQEHGISQRKLALELGLGKSTLQRLISG